MSIWNNWVARLLRSRPLSRRTCSNRKRPELCYEFRSAEALETRQLLSGIGPTWDDASRLTLSFVPDGTGVDHAQSELFQMLASMGDEAVWQATILDAFQVWAVNTNVNIGVVGDLGLPLGAPGLIQGDLRFGDIRIAAAPLADDVVAISVPRSGAISGTWVGDIVINSRAMFSGLSDLHSVVMHEAGHVLGLEHSSDPASPMFSHNSPGVSRLPTAVDVSQFQTLHGVRVNDRNEVGRSNDTIKKATRIRGNETTDHYDGTTPLMAWGDITQPTDVDFFRLDSYVGYRGPLAIELRTSEISQLHGTLSIWSSSGKLIASSDSVSGNSSTAAVLLTQETDTSQYFIRIAADTSTSKSVGTYAVVVKYVDKLTTSEQVIQEVARRRYDTLSKADVRDLLQNGGRFDHLSDDQHSDDSSSKAVRLQTTPGFAKSTHYRAIGSIADLADVDHYRIQTPSGTSATPLVFHLSVRSLAVDGLLPKVTLLNSSGTVIPVEVIANGMGVYSIQSRSLKPGTSYFVRVESATDGSEYSTGSYDLLVRFLSVAAERDVFAQSTLDAVHPTHLFQLDVDGTQLFQLGLDSTSEVGSPTTAIQLVVYDQAGNTLYQLIGVQGDLRTGESLLLTPGTYFVQVSGFRFDKKPLTKSTLRIVGNGISDPIGPVIGDPTGAPPSPTKPGSVVGPKFTWSNTPTVAQPAKIGPPPNPWGSLPVKTSDVYFWYWYSGLPAKS